MKQAQFVAAVDFAESELGGLDQAGLSLEDSKKVLAELINRRGLSIDGILRRVAGSEFARPLLGELFDRVSFAEHKAVVGSPVLRENIWDFGASEVTEFWFWTTQVNWRIGKRDYRRAWEELKQAANSQAFLSHDHSDPRTQKLAALVRRLFYAMYGMGLVKGVETDVLELKSDTETRIINEQAPSKADHLGRVRKPRAYTGTTQRAGWDLACRFRVQKAGLAVQMDGKGNNIFKYDIFDRTGQMILILARHFSDERNRRRNEKLKRAVNARQA